MEDLNIENRKLVTKLFELILAPLNVKVRDISFPTLATYRTTDGSFAPPKKEEYSELIYMVHADSSIGELILHIYSSKDLKENIKAECWRLIAEKNIQTNLAQTIKKNLHSPDFLST